MDEPSRDEAIEIVKGLKGQFEDYYKLKISNKTLVSAVDLSMRYITDRKLPDEAIDILDEAGASKTLQRKSNRNKSLTPNDLENIVCKLAKIPKNTVTNDEKELLKDLNQNLKMYIYGPVSYTHLTLPTTPYE